MTFAIGELAETKIVFGAKTRMEVWIEARIINYNSEDNTYDIDVMNAEKHKVNPRAIHVPVDYIRKMVKENDISQMVNMGYDYNLARQSLINANGNLNLAVSNLIDQNIMPTSTNSQKMTPVVSNYAPSPSTSSSKFGSSMRSVPIPACFFASQTLTFTFASMSASFGVPTAQHYPYSQQANPLPFKPFKHTSFDEVKMDALPNVKDKSNPIEDKYEESDDSSLDEAKMDELLSEPIKDKPKESQDKLVSKESKVFEDPSAPSSPPIDIMPDDAIMPPSPAQGASPKPRTSTLIQNPDQCHMAMVRRSQPRDDEFDYSVVYNEADLGFEFHSSAKKKRSAINAIVGKRVTEHAVRHIYQGSLMLAVNNTWVVGMPSTQIVEICEKALRQLPCTVTFRGKKWMRESNDQRGTLKILINNAMQLYEPATHVTVRVADAYLSTDKVPSSQEPSWEEVLMWRSFRPDHNKHAVIRVWQHSRLTASKCIGKAKVKLPSTFDKCESEIITLKSDNDEVRGILELRTMVQRSL